MNLNLASDELYQLQYIKGGYTGLESLYKSFFFSKKKSGFVFEDVKFENFIKGVRVEITSFEEEDKENKIIYSHTCYNRFYDVESFFEDYFKFEIPSPLFIKFDDSIANSLLRGCRSISNDKNLSDNQRISKLKEVVKHFEIEIKKSKEFIQTENEILNSKIKYFEENYISTYNEIFDLYSHYFPNIEKIDFKNNEAGKPEIKLKTKAQKTLFDFIHNVTDKESFANDLKNSFPTEKGKSIRVIIDCLKSENIVIIHSRGFGNFLNELKDYFGRDIGEYQGIQNKMIIDSITMEPIEKLLKPLIARYKTKE